MLSSTGDVYLSKHAVNAFTFAADSNVGSSAHSADRGMHEIRLWDLFVYVLHLLAPLFIETCLSFWHL